MIEKSQKWQKKNYDMQPKQKIFEPGDMVWRYNNEYVKGTKKKNLKKGPRWYGPYVVQSIMLTGNYYLQHKTKPMENACVYAPHHLKAYIHRNPKIPQYSNDEYELEGQSHFGIR